MYLSSNTNYHELTLIFQKVSICYPIYKILIHVKFMKIRVMKKTHIIIVNFGCMLIYKFRFICSLNESRCKFRGKDTEIISNHQIDWKNNAYHAIFLHKN